MTIDLGSSQELFEGLADELFILDGPYAGYRGVAVKCYKSPGYQKVRLLVYGRLVEVELGAHQVTPLWSTQARFKRQLEQAREDALAAWWFDATKRRPGQPQVKVTSAALWEQWEDARQEIDWCMEHMSAYLDERLNALRLDPLATESGWLNLQWEQLKAQYLRARSDLNGPQRVAALDAFYRAQAACERRQRQASLRLAISTATHGRYAQRVDRARHAVRSYIHEHLGLKLPDDVFWFWSCYQSLNSAERQLWASYVSMVPAGVIELLSHCDALSSIRSSMAHAMIGRYYHDPPEFMTVAVDRQHGLHYGLWFDDPEQAPSMIASYQTPCVWPELHREGATMMEVVLNALDYHQERLLEQENEEELALVEQLRQVVMASIESLRALGWPLALYADAALLPRVATVHGLGVATPAPKPRQRLLLPVHRALLSADAELERLKLEALKLEDPYETLALAHDFHALSAGDVQMEADASALFIAAYEALGYDALLKIAQQQACYRRRDRPDHYVLARH